MIKQAFLNSLYSFSISLKDFCEDKILKEKRNFLYEKAKELGIDTEKLKILENERKSLHIAKDNKVKKLQLRGARGKIFFKHFTEEEKPKIRGFLIAWNLYIHFLKEYDKFIKEDLPLVEELKAKEEFYEKAQGKIFPELSV